MLDAITKRRVEQALDDDGLVQGGVLDDIEQEAVRIGDYWIGLDRRVPWRLAQFIRNHFDSLREVRLRLDLTRVESVEGHMTPLRKAHWWGAPFSWDRVHARRVGGDTRHATSGENIASLGKPCQATFRWNFPRDQQIGEFQIEEFTAALEDRYGSVYLHSIVDSATRRFTHVDGAQKRYTEASYADAFESGIGKAQTYEKVFRIDGSLEPEVWMGVVATYFSDSKLVQEYFENA